MNKMLRHTRVVIQKSYKYLWFSWFFEIRFSKFLVFHLTCTKNVCHTRFSWFSFLFKIICHIIHPATIKLFHIMIGWITLLLCLFFLARVQFPYRTFLKIKNMVFLIFWNAMFKIVSISLDVCKQCWGRTAHIRRLCPGMKVHLTCTFFKSLLEPLFGLVIWK